MSNEKFTFFWHGPLSQWHPSTFVIDGIQYSCAEQYMMAEKARLFGDQDTLGIIMSAATPREQKKMGRAVKNFNANRWNAVARDRVFIGNYAKFTQDSNLKRLLLETAGTTLVEASPKDAIWGIGLAENNPRAQSRDTWLGTNWLGETLTKVRDKIQEEASA